MNERLHFYRFHTPEVLNCFFPIGQQKYPDIQYKNEEKKNQELAAHWYSYRDQAYLNCKIGNFGCVYTQI